MFTLVDKYNESKKIKKACAVLCNLCSSEHKPTQTAAGGTLCEQPTPGCAAEHQLHWGFLFSLVECPEVLRLDISIRTKTRIELSLGDTDFLFCSMIFLYLNISKDLWAFIALFLWLPVPGNWQSQALTWSRYSYPYPVMGIFLHGSQKNSGYSFIKHSKAEGFDDIQPPKVKTGSFAPRWQS